MTAPTTTSARAPGTEQSHSGVNEPSMEDILASIRRIIAEDQSNGLGRSGLNGLTRRAQSSVTPAPASQDVAPPALDDLSEIHPNPTVESDTHAAPHADILRQTYEAPIEAPVFAQPEPTVQPDHASHAEPLYDAEAVRDARGHNVRELEAEHHTPVEDDAAPLISPSVGASITSSFQTLAESVVLQDPDLIERVMRESMRPLLKTWLDDHLPSIVERLVRAEIERVARGGRKA